MPSNHFSSKYLLLICEDSFSNSSEYFSIILLQIEIASDSLYIWEVEFLSFNISSHKLSLSIKFLSPSFFIGVAFCNIWKANQTYIYIDEFQKMLFVTTTNKDQITKYTRSHLVLIFCIHLFYILTIVYHILLQA